MMFGIPGATLAMIRCAKPKRRKYALGILGSAALCAFVCGITEPFEFAFMFAAPALYVIYSLLYGVFSYVTALVGFRAGFCFSAGATDLLFSASLPAAARTWLILPLGAAAFVVFYLVFRFLIARFHLATPGSEDEAAPAEAPAKAEAVDRVAGVDLQAILQGLGGAENVVSLDHCATRLRVELKDQSLLDEARIKGAGARGVVKSGPTSVQVVIGLKVQAVADELQKRLG